MTNYEKEFPELFQFVGLFNQDWKDMFDWQGSNPHYAPVVRFYKTHNPLSFTQQTTREVKNLLMLNVEEDYLKEILLNEFALCIRPNYWNLTYREWLENILTILEEPIEKTKKEFIPRFVG
jgi:hypothetical protein